MTLTPRQTQILKLIARGHRDKEIACRLRISERTVEIHILRAIKTLNAVNRPHAVYLVFACRVLS